MHVFSRKLVFAGLLLMLFVLPAAAFQLFMPGDPEVDQLLTLYNSAGHVFPDASWPISLADLDEYAARLLDYLAEQDRQSEVRYAESPSEGLLEDVSAADEQPKGSEQPYKPESLMDPLHSLSKKEKRSAALQSMLREYREMLDYEPGRVVRGSSLSIRPAAFLNGDVYIPEPGLPGSGDPVAHVRYPNDFYNRFVEFPDMAQLALFAGAQGQSGLSISAGVKREYNEGTVPDLNLFIRTSDDPAKIENYLIRTGYLAWRSDRFEAWLGRAPVHYGDARFSTFLPSERLPWLDAFTYRYRLGPLSMTSYFGTIDNRMSEDEQVIFLDNSGEIAADAGTVGFLAADPNIVGRENVLTLDVNPTGYAFGETVILNSMHRFVLGWEKMCLGITAAMITARENNALVIGDIFPVFSWHNALVGHHNMHLVFDLAYAVRPGLGFYGQAAWDDINASDFSSIPDSSIPTIGAYLAGLVYQPEWWGLIGGTAGGRITPGLTLKAEIGRTHYLWGNYYAYHEGKGSYLSRAIYRYKGQKGQYWLPLTSPYGPGTWWVEGEGNFDARPDLSFTSGFTFLRFNPEVNLFTTPYVRDDEIDDREYDTSFSIYLETLYTLELNEANELRLRLVPVWYSLKGHTWPELEISAELLRQKVRDF